MYLFTKTPSILSGERFSADEPARPSIDGCDLPCRRIEIAGGIDHLSREGVFFACRRARLDPNVRAVLFPINCGLSLWEIGDVVEAIARLGRDKLTIAYIDGAALGTSILAALACRVIFASPQAAVGHLACFAAGEACLGERIAAECNASTLGRLQLLRPDVPNRIWHRLFDSSISNAEELEHFNIIDFICRTEIDLLSKFTFSAEAQR
jgi:hypothetical protein